MLAVGDRVATNLDHAWLWRGTEAEGLMGKARSGTVVELPWAYRHHGIGTIRVRWDSLTGSDNSGDNWLRWVHSNLINVA